jgi:hypothetical protein
MTYIFIGRYSTRRVARFISTLPSFALYLTLIARQIPLEDKLITDSAVPFFETLGIECSQDYWQARDFEKSILRRDVVHHLTLVGFAVLLICYLLSGISVIWLELNKPCQGRSVFAALNIQGVKMLSKIKGWPLLFICIALYSCGCIVAYLGIYQLFIHRQTFVAWCALSGTAEATQWGFGQIISLFVWGNVLWSIASFFGKRILTFFTLHGRREKVSDSSAPDTGFFDSPENAVDSTTRPLLLVPIGGTILMSSPRRLRACGLPNKKLRHPIFIRAEAWETNTNMNTGWFALHLISIPLIKKGSSSRRWRRWRWRTKTMMKTNDWEK